MRNFLPLTFLLFFVSALQSAVTLRDVSGLFGSPANIYNYSSPYGGQAAHWADLQPVCLGSGEELQISLQMPDWSTTTFPNGGFDHFSGWQSTIDMWDSSGERYGVNSMSMSVNYHESFGGTAWGVPVSYGSGTVSISANPVGVELIYKIREDGGDLLLDLVVVDSSGMIVYETATDGRTVRAEHGTECFEASVYVNESMRGSIPEPGGMFLALLGGAILTLGSRRR